MTRRSSAAPTALGSSSIDFPALPGWAHIWRSALLRISCGTWWLRWASCAFLHGNAHTRFSPVQLGRKSGSGPCIHGDLRPVISPNDTEQRVGSATTPLKPKEGLNGPRIFLGWGAGSFVLNLPQASQAAPDEQQRTVGVPRLFCYCRTPGVSSPSKLPQEMSGWL